MWTTIVNPKTNKLVSIYSKIGQSVLKKYIQRMNKLHGGSVKKILTAAAVAAGAVGTVGTAGSPNGTGNSAAIFTRNYGEFSPFYSQGNNGFNNHGMNGSFSTGFSTDNIPTAAAYDSSNYLQQPTSTLYADAESSPSGLGTSNPNNKPISRGYFKLDGISRQNPYVDITLNGKEIKLKYLGKGIQHAAFEYRDETDNKDKILKFDYALNIGEKLPMFTESNEDQEKAAEKGLLASEKITDFNGAFDFKNKRVIQINAITRVTTSDKLDTNVFSNTYSMVFWELADVIDTYKKMLEQDLIHLDGHHGNIAYSDWLQGTDSDGNIDETGEFDYRMVRFIDGDGIFDISKKANLKPTKLLNEDVVENIDWYRGMGRNLKNTIGDLLKFDKEDSRKVDDEEERNQLLFKQVGNNLIKLFGLNGEMWNTEAAKLTPKQQVYILSVGKLCRLINAELRPIMRDSEDSITNFNRAMREYGDIMGKKWGKDITKYINL